MSTAGAWRREDGQVMAFVVLMFLALLLFAGLVIDGGLALAAKRRAINEAEAAARAGAQEVATTTFRISGRVVLDPARAHAAALAYLRQTGDPGEAHVTADRVIVIVHVTQPLPLLSLAGLGTLRLDGHGVAVPEHGVQGAEP